MKNFTFLCMLFIFISLGFFRKDVTAQSKLIAAVPPATCNMNLTGAQDAELFPLLMPVDERSFGSISEKITNGNYDELHIFVTAEADRIVFHGFTLSLSSLKDHAAMLEKFKAFTGKIIFHSTVLGKGEKGKLFLDALSEYMGHNIEVQN